MDPVIDLINRQIHDILYEICTKIGEDSENTKRDFPKLFTNKRLNRQLFIRYFAENEDYFRDRLNDRPHTYPLLYKSAERLLKISPEIYPEKKLAEKMGWVLKMDRLCKKYGNGLFSAIIG